METIKRIMDNRFNLFAKYNTAFSWK